MKKLTSNRRQILRAIQAVLVALFLAGAFGRAVADAAYGPGFRVDGSTVVGSGQNTATYFYDPSLASYNIGIQTGANLNNTGSGYTNLIQFGQGSVTNSGTLTSTNSAIYFYNYDFAAPGGTVSQNVHNTSTGVITGSTYGIYLYNYVDGGAATNLSQSIANEGAINSNSSDAPVAIFNYNYYANGNITDSISFSNASTGKLNNGYYGLYTINYGYENYGTASEIFTGSNAGSINGTQYGIYGYNEDYYNDSSSATSVTEAFNFSNSGSVTGPANTGLYFYNYPYYNYYATTVSAVANVTNSNYIMGGSYGFYFGNYNDYNGYYAPGSQISNAINLRNSGNIVGSSGTGSFIYNVDYYNGYYTGAANSSNVSNAIAVTNSGSMQGGDYGLYAYNYQYYNYNGGNVSNVLTLNNSGFLGGIGATASADYGAYLYNDNESNYYDTSESNSLTVNNSGRIYGYGGLYAYNYDYYAGYYNGASVISAISLSNSGYIGGSGSYGIYAYNDTESTGVDASVSQPASSSLTISNTGTVIAQSNSAVYAYNDLNSINGNASSTIQVDNSGKIQSFGGDGLHLYSTISSASGTESATINVVNSSTGVIQGTGSGIYVSNTVDALNGTQSSNVTNYGQVSGSNYGVYFNSANSSLVTAGGLISGGTDAVYLGGTASTVTVQGRSNIQGAIEGNNNGNTLNLDLILSPTQAVALKSEIALVGAGMGTFIDSTGDVYNWDGFAMVNANTVSLETSVDPGLRTIATRIDNIGLAQNTGSGTNGAQLDAFYIAAYNNPESALNELVGREVNQAVDTMGVNLNTTVASDVQNHLDDLLTGNQIGGVDLSGLQVGGTGDMYAFSDTTSQLDSLLNMADGLNFQGTEMSDSKGAAFVSKPAPVWGVWASGNVTLGDQSSTNTMPGFHSTLGTPTLGVDMRITPSLVLGLLGSYTTGDATFADGTKLGSNIELAAFYGAWRQGNWHVDGLAGGGHAEFDNSRTTFGGTATSNPDGYDVLTDWTGGYDFHLADRWIVTPEAGLQYTHLGLDSYAESGAGALDLNVGSQDIDSLRSHIGFKVNRAYSLGKDLTFMPELRAQWYHEFLDDSRGVATSLPGSPALGSFPVGTSSPQRDFALLGVGLNTAFTGYHDIPVGMFVNYDVQVGQSDYIANSVNAGIRFDF